MSQQPPPPQAQPTSVAGQPVPPSQRQQLPPRPVVQAQAPSDPNKPQAAPRRLAESKGSNPFADPARRRAQLDLLRSDRNVEPPKERAGDSNDAPSVEPAGPTDSKSDDAGPSEPSRSFSPAAGADTALSVLQAQYQAREAAVATAEAKVRDATNKAERRAAEAEAAEKRSEAKLKRLEMVAHDPVQFLSDAGITDGDFKSYLANGGQQTPEQKRIAAQEAEVRQLRDEMAAMRKQNEQHRTQAQRDAEDNLFAQTMKTSDDYTLVAAVGGIGAVRNHQATLGKQLDKPVSLAEAAAHLETEFQGNFLKILALDTVRRKLGLQPPGDKPARESKPQTRTLDGAHSSSTPAMNGAKPAWNDWKGKLEIYKREQQRAHKQ